MEIKTFSFSKDWTNPADFPTFQESEILVRQAMQALPNELRDFVNYLVEKMLVMDGVVSSKSDQVSTDAKIAGSVKNVIVDTATGIITIEKNDGSTQKYDTALEKVPAKMELIEENGRTILRVTNQDGSTSETDVTNLVEEFTFAGDGVIKVTRNGYDVTIGLGTGVVSLRHLSSEVTDFVDSARKSAEESAAAASVSRSLSESARTGAEQYATSARESAAKAKISEESAAKSASDAAEALNTLQKTVDTSVEEAVRQATQEANAARDESVSAKNGAVKAAEGAEKAKQAIEDMSVTGTTVDSDSTLPAVEKQVGEDGNINLHFNLRRGKAFIYEDFTEEQLEELKGPKGGPGKSAYEYAQEGGYVGTESEFAYKLAFMMEQDVVGMVDENNVVHVRGLVPDGEYMVKYEMDNGTIVEVGKMVLDSNVYHIVSNILTGCTNSNVAEKVIEGRSYSATISPNDGLFIRSITVTMGGEDITSSAVSGANINIANVTGDIVITAVAVEPVTVDIPLTDGIRIGSDGGDRTLAGHCATEMIDLRNIAKPCTINLTKARWCSDGTTTTIRYYVADADGNMLGADATVVKTTDHITIEAIDGHYGNVVVTVTSDDVGYVRFSANWTNSNYSDSDSRFADAHTKATLTYVPTL